MNEGSGTVTILEHMVAWLIAGGLAGAIVGMLVTRSKGGYGLWLNIGIGLIGALIGNALFAVLGIQFGSELAVSFRDLVAAFVGSFIFLGAVWIARRRMGRDGGSKPPGSGPPRY